jgi:DNA (cytosine-5)-methyltransferase 1
MKLLDLFCGAGGAAMGYYRAGILDITGVDLTPQPRYPFRFIQADALMYVRRYGHLYDLIHASPPCQLYSQLARIGWEKEYSDLIGDLRLALQDIDKPYVIENVPGAPLRDPLLLCGTMFGLYIIRHRLFECNPVLWFPPATCSHSLPVVKCGRKPDRFREFASLAGNFSDVEYGRIASGIHWMVREELSQAIPPAYTEYIGRCLLELID